MSRTESVYMQVGEGTRRDLEAVVPVTVVQGLQTVSDEGQVAGLPLLQHVTVLM